MRKTVFANEEFYHIFNRGVDKREVFLDEEDYSRFLTCLREFNRPDAIGSLYEKSFKDKKFKKGENLEAKPPIGGLASKFSSVASYELVEINVYCLNPNHYHFILRQLVENGIRIFMQKVGTAYTMYFNKKYERSGSLFQGPFKAVQIDSNEYLLHLSVYVNKNYFIHGYDEGKFLEAKPPSEINYPFLFDNNYSTLFSLSFHIQHNKIFSLQKNLLSSTDNSLDYLI